MEYPLKIHTIEKTSESKLKEKGSLFISRIYYSENEKHALEIIINNRREFYDATHCCYAFRFVDGKIKYSDDGEPSGTAGIRILNAIEHDNLFNQLVVVIRYFGGTKLGVGPLGKAYYNSARMVIEKSLILEKSLHQLIIIRSDFSLISNVYHILNQVGGKIIKENYAVDAEFNALVLPDKIKPIRDFLVGVSQNQIKIEEKEQIEYI